MRKNSYKIALQFFGHLRSYRETYPYQVAHILSKYDCDVFIHTWETEEHDDPSWHKASSGKNDVALTNRDHLIECYQPIALEIEDNAMIMHDGYFNSNNNILLRAMKAMYHSQQKVNILRQEYALNNSIDYDFVITLRPDVMPLSILSLEDYIKEFEFSSNVCIHFSNGYHQHIQGQKKIYTNLASDIFYLSTVEVMDTVFNRQDNTFERFYIDFNQVNLGGISAPEACFSELLLQRGIISRFYEFPYVIIRTSGSNHLRVNFEALDKFERMLDVPVYLQNRDGISKNTLMYRLFSKLNNKNIERIQNEIYRHKRRLDTFHDWLKFIKESR
ncbi:hypothetical protein ERJ77_09365 [Vibrio anguillarum]|uniref:Uncharacterized protein n=2 Tax=Vibrio TaxID=662 RepID=A0AAW4BCG0_VIBAN|nr:hypothetical protein [Vibrio anguillarum]OXX26174.1 hypothetical protein B9J88_02620 [Vibrio sp. V05_P4A8T149]OXX30819.1 hypothetical protein B9J81_15170 [Vibrio sp. V04_P4A5T148]OXX31315.1 hypothetical protein B9J95_09340 [Vibrio sp. V14_P6S14T42]OXX51545.1 hypothetical protein B9J91_16880 [Vibrio sp. V18_P1S4T112]